MSCLGTCCAKYLYSSSPLNSAQCTPVASCSKHCDCHPSKELAKCLKQGGTQQLQDKALVASKSCVWAPSLSNPWLFLLEVWSRDRFLFSRHRNTTGLFHALMFCCLWCTCRSDVPVDIHSQTKAMDGFGRFRLHGGFMICGKSLSWSCMLRSKGPKDQGTLVWWSVYESIKEGKWNLDGGPPR